MSGNEERMRHLSKHGRDSAPRNWSYFAVWSGYFDRATYTTAFDASRVGVGMVVNLMSPSYTRVSSEGRPR